MDQIHRFGLFEIDAASGELRKQGRLVRLQDQPFQVLLYLVQRAGETVSREELQQAVWPADTFVDFDHGVNTAIKKIRAALGDSADNPTFIETLPRKGYRFIAPVSSGVGVPTAEAAPAAPAVPGPGWVVPAAVVVGLMIAAVVATWWMGRGPAGAKAPPVLPLAESLTAYPGVETDPHFSPDGRRVVFSWDGPNRDNFDIYVKELGVEVPVRLTTNPNRDFGAAFSPDGKRIAFVRPMPGKAPLAVFVVPAEGGPEVQVGESYYPNAYPFPGPMLSWTPDGRWVIVHGGGEQGTTGQGLRSLPVSGGEAHWLVAPPSDLKGDCCGAFSPDGRTLAFVRFEESFHEVWLQRMSPAFTPEGGPRKLTSLKLLASSPTWMPDGKSIVFSAGGSVRSFLWRVAIEGTEQPVPLTSLGDDVTRPTISASGQLVYEQGHAESDLWTADLGEGKPPRRIVSANREDLSAHFSPDGRRIVFISSRSGENEVWVANADGTQPMRLTSMRAGVTGWPSFSPDGTRVLFDSNQTGHYHLYTISAVGGEPVQITSGNWTNGVGRWSRDGKWIFFTSERTGKTQLWRMPATGGEPTQLTRQGARLGMESADGHYVYFGKAGQGQTELWRVPKEGGEEVKVLDGVPSFQFVPVEGGVYYVKAGAGDQGWELVRHTWADGKHEVVFRSPAGSIGAGLDVTPDGRTVLFSQREPASSDLKLVQLPRWD